MTGEDSAPRVPVAVDAPAGAPPRTPLGWFRTLARDRRGDYTRSDRTLALTHPWPPGFDPATSAVYAHNALDIGAPPAVVFGVLVAATEWPSLYPNAAEVVIEDGKETVLRAGARFTWITFAVRQESEVTLFNPDVALGWTADSPGTRAFHRWWIEPRGGGCRLVTEEAQFGPVAFVGRYWMNRSLRAAHQLWLECIRDRVA